MVPSSLNHLIAAALDAAREHPQHALLPLQRYTIYEYLGSIKEARGYRRRAWLAVLTAEHVLPLWQQVRPHDNRAEHLLTLAKEVLRAHADM